MKLQCEDSLELRRYIEREYFKWLSHEAENEILEIVSNNLLRSLTAEIQESGYFGLLIDETMDVSKKEQVSLCLRVVLKELEVKEYFIGFYETSATDAETLFNIGNDILVRLGLNIQNCCGRWGREFKRKI